MIVRYEPRHDITAFELASIIKEIAATDLTAHWGIQMSEDEFDRLPKRHFVVVEQKYRPAMDFQMGEIV